MKRIAVSSIAVAGTLLLTACGGSSRTEDTASTPEVSRPALPPPTTAEPSPTAEPTPEGPPLSPRGNIIKAIGEEGGFGDESDPGLVVTFAIDSIAPVECTEEYYDYQPENGQLIAVQMRFATAPELATSPISYFSVSPYEFQYVGADGITVTDLATIATYGCLPEKEMLTSSQMMPGSQYVGKVILDVPAPSGLLIYRPSAVMEGGWEWNF